MVEENNWIKDRFRKVHLDFHTPPWVKVGEDFNKEEFGRILKEANINVVPIFAKCHFGMSYYNTKVGKRHPGLGFDLLGEMVDACHSNDIKVMAYYSAVWDNNVGESHPGWQQVNKDKVPQDAGFWKSICINSPYVNEVLHPQVREVVQGYDVDGMWFDIVLFMQEACFCQYCLELMKKEGINPDDKEAHALFNQVARQNFLKETTGLIKSLKSDCQVTYNNLVKIGSRESIDYLDIFEIESLPHGWGLLYYPLYSRHIRKLNKPFNGITARFHKSWGDFGSLKSPAQLKYETATMLAQGGMCSIGDQLSYRGKLEKNTYKVIGEVYDFIKKREKWCIGQRSVPYIAILADKEYGTPGIAGGKTSLWGATKALIESHYHFDIIDEEIEFGDYKAIVLPGNHGLSDEAIEKLKKYVLNGGRLVASDSAGVDSKGGDFNLGDLFGLRYKGEFPYSLDYVRILDGSIKENLPSMDMVVYGKSVEVELKGAHVLAEIVHPLCERSREKFYSHFQAPPGDKGESPAITVHKKGAGVAAYIASPIFQSYFEDGNTVFRVIVDNLLKKIIPAEDRLLSMDGAISIEVSLMDDKASGRTIIHMVNYHAEKRGKSVEVIEEVPEVYNISIRVQHKEEPRKVYLAPSEEEVEWKRDGNFLNIKVPYLHIHQMVVIE